MRGLSRVLWGVDIFSPPHVLICLGPVLIHLSYAHRLHTFRIFTPFNSRVAPCNSRAKATPRSSKTCNLKGTRWSVRTILTVRTAGRFAPQSTKFLPFQPRFEYQELFSHTKQHRTARSKQTSKILFSLTFSLSHRFITLARCAECGCPGSTHGPAAYSLRLRVSCSISTWCLLRLREQW